MLGDPPPPDVIALPGVITGATTLTPEVQPPEEQRPFGQFPHLLGPTAEPVPEHFGIGTGRGDVLPGEDMFLSTVDHRGEGVAAGVVVGAFLGEGSDEKGFG